MPGTTFWSVSDALKMARPSKYFQVERIWWMLVDAEEEIVCRPKTFLNVVVICSYTKL